MYIYIYVYYRYACVLKTHVICTRMLCVLKTYICMHAHTYILHESKHWHALLYRALCSVTLYMYNTAFYSSKYPHLVCQRTHLWRRGPDMQFSTRSGKTNNSIAALYYSRFKKRYICFKLETKCFHVHIYIYIYVHTHACTCNSMLSLSLKKHVPRR